MVSLTRLKTHGVVKGFLRLRVYSFFPLLFDHLGEKEGGRGRQRERERGSKKNIKLYTLYGQKGDTIVTSILVDALDPPSYGVHR